MKNIKERRILLEQRIRELGRVALAYSGGVDSTLLLRICLDILGEGNVLAIVARTELLPDHDLRHALNTLERLRCRYIILEKPILNIREINKNSRDRCYQCKKEIFTALKNEALDEGLKCVLDGTNHDDLTGSYRPGTRALKELGIISPFAEFNITKEEVRNWARELKLPGWDRPSASCLATRIPYGEKLTPEMLKTVEDAENILRQLNLGQSRVRIHQNIARIEVIEHDFKKILSSKNRLFLIKRFKELGLKFIDLDLEGYRSGSMDN